MRKPKEPEDFDRRMEDLRKQKELFDREKEIRDLKQQMRRWHPPTTTKVLMAFIFGNCTMVEIYSMVVMYKLADLSALYSLISAVVTESVAFAIYAAKAYNETKQEELVKLERDKMNFYAVPDEEEEEEPTREAAMG